MQDVAMRKCASENERQLWHYDVETRAIRGLEYCLEYYTEPEVTIGGVRVNVGGIYPIYAFLGGNVFANVSRVDHRVICHRCQRLNLLGAFDL